VSCVHALVRLLSLLSLLVCLLPSLLSLCLSLFLSLPCSPSTATRPLHLLRNHVRPLLTSPPSPPQEKRKYSLQHGETLGCLMVHTPSHDPLSPRLLDQVNVDSINPVVSAGTTSMSRNRASSTATVTALTFEPAPQLSSSSFSHDQHQRFNYPRPGDSNRSHPSKSFSFSSISTRDEDGDEDGDDDDDEEDEDVGDELQPVLAAVVQGRPKPSKKPTFLGEFACC